VNRREKRLKFHSTADHARYGRSELEHLKQPISLMANRLRKRGVSGFVVELGSGKGALKEVSDDYIGIDISHYALTRYLPGKRRVSADIEDLPLKDSSARFIFTVATLEHLPHPERTLAEIDRTLSPGGIAFIAPSWFVRPWASKGLLAKSFKELSFLEKLERLSLPIRNSYLFRGLITLPKRIIREMLYLIARKPTPFRYRRLKPNLDLYSGSDSDAFSSLDPHEVILYYLSRGFTILSHKGLLARLTATHRPVIVMKKKEAIKGWKEEEALTDWKDISRGREMPEIAKNIGIANLATLINLGANFILSIIIARFLGVSPLGIYALGSAVAGLSFSFLAFGTRTIMTRETAKDPQQGKRYIANTLGIRFLITFPLGFLVIYLFGTLLMPGLLSTLLLIGLSVALTNIHGVFFGIFQARGRFHYQLLAISLQKGLAIGGGVSLLLLGGSLNQLILLLSIAHAIALLISLVLATKRITPIRISFDLPFIRGFIRESFPLALASFSEFINLKSDTIMLGPMKGERATGIYNAAYGILLGLSSLAYSISVACFPSFSRAYSRSKEEIKRLFKTVTAFTLFMSSLSALILIIFAKPIIRLIYGERFLAASLPLAILAFALIFISLNRLAIAGLNSSGRQRDSFRIIGGGAVINVILNIIFIPRYSYLGASITTVITEALVFAASYITFLGHLREKKLG
jgi:O-antigen/teichoic acid export membrane protein/SAM-dependent methyltransferase